VARRCHVFAPDFKGGPSRIAAAGRWTARASRLELLASSVPGIGAKPLVNGSSQGCVVHILCTGLAIDVNCTSAKRKLGSNCSVISLRLLGFKCRGRQHQSVRRVLFRSLIQSWQDGRRCKTISRIVLFHHLLLLQLGEPFEAILSPLWPLSRSLPL